jgi:hypothetical protein
MRVIRSKVNPSHPDYEILSTIKVEIETRLGGNSSARQQFTGAVRDAVDFVLDPVRTARTRVTELDNVEKTFIGLKLEHFLRDLLDVPKGLRDLEIAGMDVDIKNTVRDNWSIPIETYRNSEPCLLMAVNDDTYHCWLGIIVAKSEYLRPGANRDSKKGVSTTGKENILWLVEGAPFPKSRFSELDMNRFREIRKIRGGSKRATIFFSENVGKPIHRSVIHALLYPQDDYMKRLRANGGARDKLRKKGIALLSGNYDSALIKMLSLPDTAKDEMISFAPTTASEITTLVALDKIDTTDDSQP